MLNRATYLGLSASLLFVAWSAGGCDEESNTTDAGPSSTTTQSGGGGAGNGGVGAGASVGGSGAGGGGAQGGGGGVTTVGNVNCDPASGTPGNLVLGEVANGFNQPIGVVSAWGDSDRLYVFEQPGRIQLVMGGNVTEFLDITNVVSTSANERGLLGVAFHPNYVENGRLFVHYSNDGGNGPGAGEGDTVIEEYRRDPNNPDVADPAAVQLIYTTDQPAGNHNGGTIAFDPIDGHLWIGLGDGGGGYDTYNQGQTKSTPLAALLRLDVDSAQPYASPAGNITDGAAEVHDWGLRNPYRWSFDVCTGDRYIGDVGQDCWEEISIVAANAGNVNFGWPEMEANNCLGNNGSQCLGTPPADCDNTGMEGADVALDTSTYATVVGGHVYRGTAIPWLRGAYIYSDYGSSAVWWLRAVDGQVTEGPTEISGQIGLPVSAGYGLDNDGELYVVGRQQGALYRINAE